MKYFIDTEFIEEAQKTWFGGKTKPTIDLISIGIVAEDGREYYAISKDFNLKEAWNRYDLKPDISKGGMKKVYWIRENVLKPIWAELYEKEHNVSMEGYEDIDLSSVPEWNYKYLKYLINKYGKTNKQIAEEIKKFTYTNLNYTDYNNINSNIQFYGYYSDYDWVVFCWLFGRMNELPKGFPMYCIDLKQELDRKVNKFNRNDFFTAFDFKNEGLKELTLEEKLNHIKFHVSYPKQTNEHNALNDAKWNKELYEFLNSI